MLTIILAPTLLVAGGAYAQNNALPQQYSAEAFLSPGKNLILAF